MTSAHVINRAVAEHWNPREAFRLFSIPIPSAGDDVLLASLLITSISDEQVLFTEHCSDRSPWPVININSAVNVESVVSIDLAILREWCSTSGFLVQLRWIDLFMPYGGELI